MTVLPSLRHPLDRQPDEEFILHSLGRGWTLGAAVDWSSLYGDEHRRRVSLPTYPFERQRYWIAPDSTEIGAPQPPAPAQTIAGTASSLESTLSGIFASLLGVDRIRPSDSFFDLGGDSLLAVQLITRIRDRTGVELQLQQVLEAPTVAAMARLLEQWRSTSQRAPLVALNRTGANPPLVLIHPAGGTVLCYLELTRGLGAEQPVYALQSPGLTGEAEPTTIEAAAQRYVDELRSVQPHGPYRLAGLSYGGNVAFEMCRLLHDDREDVELLAMFDSHPPPTYHTQPPDDTSYILAFPSILQLYAGRQPRMNRSDLAALSSDQQVDYLVHRIRSARVLPTDIDDGGIKLLFRLWKTHLLALRAHHPAPLRHAQRIAFFRAVEPQPPRLPKLLHIDLEHDIAAWQALTPGPIELHEVPGSHYTMLRPGNVEALVPLLQREVVHAV
jgi:thioesterase domain-containing protein/acyl carrier protein